MALYARGNSAAFDELFRRWERRIFGFFVRKTGSEQRALDLFQELFLRLHRFRDRYDPARPFAPWLLQMARRVWLDDLRGTLGLQEIELEDTEMASDADPEAHAIARDEAWGVLASLGPDQQHILVAAKVGGFDYSEIARAAGRSESAVKQIASRAMRKLRAAR
jgi:RNA polymerase sigma-70 factor (ECF subfamily)